MKYHHKSLVRAVILLSVLMGMSFISSCKWGSWDLFGGDPVLDDGSDGNSRSPDDEDEDETNFPPVVFSAAQGGTKINEPVRLYYSFEDGLEKEITGVINQDSIGDDFKVSPDGTLVAYLTNENNGQFELFVVPVEGGDSTRISPSLSDNADEIEFKWSPDGSRIAYRADPALGDRFELFTNLAEGGDNRKVSGTLPADGQVESFEWSPDSQRIAYLADITIDEQFELYTNFPTGGDNTKVSGGRNVTGFAWAPAEPSEQLAYSTERQIFTVLQDGSSRSEITPELIPGGSIFEFAWAPDSSRIAYRADQNVDEVVELFTVTPDGGDNRKVSGDLTATGSVTEFAWAPYSDFIAYRANQDTAITFELYVTSPDGSSGDTKVSGTPMAGGVEPDFAWSPELDPPQPDRVRVAYRADQRTADTTELFTSTPDGQTNDRVCGRLDDGGVVEGFAWAPDNSGIGYIADQESLNVFELFASLPDGGENMKLSGTIGNDGDVLFFEWVPSN